MIKQMRIMNSIRSRNFQTWIPALKKSVEMMKNGLRFRNQFNKTTQRPMARFRSWQMI